MLPRRLKKRSVSYRKELEGAWTPALPPAPWGRALFPVDLVLLQGGLTACAFRGCWMALPVYSGKLLVDAGETLSKSYLLVPGRIMGNASLAKHSSTSFFHVSNSFLCVTPPLSH